MVHTAAIRTREGTGEKRGEKKGRKEEKKKGGMGIVGREIAASRLLKQREGREFYILLEQERKCRKRRGKVKRRSRFIG